MSLQHNAPWLTKNNPRQHWGFRAGPGEGVCGFRGVSVWETQPELRPRPVCSVGSVTGRSSRWDARVWPWAPRLHLQERPGCGPGQAPHASPPRFLLPRSRPLRLLHPASCSASLQHQLVAEMFSRARQGARLGVSGGRTLPALGVQESGKREWPPSSWRLWLYPETPEEDAGLRLGHFPHLQPLGLNTGCSWSLKQINPPGRQSQAWVCARQFTGIRFCQATWFDGRQGTRAAATQSPRQDKSPGIR